MNNKFWGKIGLGAIIMTYGILTYSDKVGLFDIKIKYDIVPDSINQHTQTSVISSDTGNKNNEISVKENDNSAKIMNSIFSDIINSSDTESSTHGVSDDFTYNTALYDKVCEKSGKICKYIYFNGDFSPEDKIKYLTIISEVINRLDNILTTDGFLKDNLYSIRLNKTQDGRRGFAGHHTITSNLKTILTKKEFFEVMTHELGHIIDLGMIKGNSSSKDKNYTEFNQPAFEIDDPSIGFYQLSWRNESTRRSGSSFKDFVSGYGMSDPFEDFAECVNMYINHHDLMEEMATSNYVISQKMEYIKKLFGNSYILSDQKNISKIRKDPTRRVWDTTKIK